MSPDPNAPEVASRTGALPSVDTEGHSELEGPSPEPSGETTEGFGTYSTYSAETTYDEGALVIDFLATTSADYLYESLADENVGNDPSEDSGVHWRPIGPVRQTVAATPRPVAFGPAGIFPGDQSPETKNGV